MSWALEDDVNDYIKEKLDRLHLKKGEDYNVESSMSDYMKEALRGGAKTKNKSNFGKPDFHIEKYKIPVIFENKLNRNKLIAKTKEGMKEDEKSVTGFAVNGALYYATQMIDSDKYNEVVAIGIAGDSEDDVEIAVYYVYGSSMKTVKLMEGYSTLDFLENEESFASFYKDAVLTEEEKHEILITSKKTLNEYAGKLNRLMHNHNITAPQRVLYISGLLLAMQDVVSLEGVKIQDGLTPDDLKGIATDSMRDGVLITRQIEEFLKAKNMESDKIELMLASFLEISKDKQRDEITKNDKAISKFLKTESSPNKQIFTFLYEYVFRQIDSIAGHIDIIGEMYSEFLKYALGDGKEIGIVLTPPYITKMMAEVLDITDESRVMDLATGSAGFLISGMQLMIASAENRWGRGTTRAKEKIEEIKRRQLLGIELNAEMYVLAATNMILRGDGSSNIQKGNSLNRPSELYESFKADRLLLNPPFTFEENGLPFIAFGLDKMEKGGLGAIIIQDSAGSGQAKASTRAILKKHTLLASIKMPVDLFLPMAGVQTSIYIFEAGTPHDFEKPVKFIDFRNDGYKRTKRGINEIDNPTQRYQDIIKIYKAGKVAKVEKNLWDLDAIYIEDFINDSGQDWNFDQHKKVDTEPVLNDFRQVVQDYLAWEITNILKGDAYLEKIDSPRFEKLKSEFIQNGGEWRQVRVGDLFDIHPTKNYSLTNDKLFKTNGKVPVIVNSSFDNGIGGYVDLEPLEKGGIVTFSDTTTSDSIFYQPQAFIGYSHVQGMYPYDKVNWTGKSLVYFCVAFRKATKGLFDYGNKFNRTRAKEILIILPYMNGNLSFSYMERYIAEIEKTCLDQLDSYLTAT